MMIVMKITKYAHERRSEYNETPNNGNCKFFMNSIPFNISTGIKAVLAGILKTKTIKRKQFIKRIISKTIMRRVSIKRLRKFLKPESLILSPSSTLSLPEEGGIIFPISPGMALMDSTTLLNKSGRVVVPSPSKLAKYKGMFAMLVPIPENNSEEANPSTNLPGKSSIILKIFVNKSLKPIELKFSIN